MSYGAEWLQRLRKALARRDVAAVEVLVPSSESAASTAKRLAFMAFYITDLEYLGERETDVGIVCVARTPWRSYVEFPLVRQDNELRLDIDPGELHDLLVPTRAYEVDSGYSGAGVWVQQWGFVTVVLRNPPIPPRRSKAISGVHALSATCTNEAASLNYLEDSNQFKCPACGSLYTITGSVVRGPATEPLRRLSVVIDTEDRVWVLRSDPPWLTWIRTREKQ